MSRQDFEHIAEVLNKWWHDRDGEPQDLLRDMADALQSTNALFDRERFMAACVKPEEES